MNSWGAENVQVIYDMPEAEYHASSGLGQGKYLTRSMVALMSKNKGLFRLRYVEKHPMAQFHGNNGCRTGCLVEALAEDKHDAYQVTEEYATKGGNMSTAVNAKAWLADLAKQGITGCTQSELEEAKFYWERLQEHKTCATVLKYADKRQVVIRWKDKATGLWLQVRLDFALQGRFLGDLKTGREPVRKFLQVAEDLGYVFQPPLYGRAWHFAFGEDLPFVFAYQQTSEPWENDLLQLPDMVIENADRRARQAIDDIAAQDWSNQREGVRIVEPDFWWTAAHESMTG